MSWHIGELLIQKKLITWEQLREVLAEQEKTKELAGQILVRKGYVSLSLLYKTLAEQFQMRFVDLKRIRITQAALDAVPRSAAVKYSLMPIDIHQGQLLVAIDNPVHSWPEEDLKRLTGLEKIKAFLALPSAIQEAIEEYYGKKAIPV